MIPLGVLASSYVAPAGGRMLTSDSFDRANGALNGSYTDIAYGGTAIMWYNNASYEIDTNQLKSTSSLVRWAAVNVGTNNMAVSAKITTMGTVRLHASSNTFDPRTAAYSVLIGSDGSLTLDVEFVGVTVLGTAAAGTVVAGDVVQLVNVDKALEVLVNGVSEITATDTTGFFPGNYAAIRSTSAAWRLDDFKVEEPAWPTPT